MKKFLTILCMLLMSCSVAMARPHHHGGHYAPAPYYYGGHHHHHHGSNVAAGIAVGLIGGTIINSLMQPRVVHTTTYAPIAYSPAPTIITQPAVVQAPVFVSTPTIISQPCYSSTNIVTGLTTSSCR